MKKTEEEAIRPEYDFTQGVRGKHHRDYTKGHKVEVRKTDGTVVVQHFKLEEGAGLTHSRRTRVPASHSCSASSPA